MSEFVYSFNNEDFDWDDPEECLDHEFYNLSPGDWPSIWTVYEGEVTDIELLEPAGAFRVIPKTKIEYQLAGDPHNQSPEWIKLCEK